MPALSPRPAGDRAPRPAGDPADPALAASLVDRLRSVGTVAGLDALGVAPADVFRGTLVDLTTRKEAGLHGGMQFTYRNPIRSTDPSAAMADVRSLVVGARSYRREAPPRPDGVGPVARVARYAWRDHYAELRVGLDAVASALWEAGWQARVVCDDNALVDREAAHRAGLGWYGKNANLLLPGHGSWFVLGSVLTDAPLEPTSDPPSDGCGACTRCIDGCPTGAIVAPGVVDARRCLAWLVQSGGDFPPEYRVALGDRLYGCDECQEVCPPNRREDRALFPSPDAATTAGDPPSSPGHPGDQAWVAVLDLLSASDAELLDRHGRWYVPRREARYLRRNALLVLGNVGDADDARVTTAVRAALCNDDPLLRSHAVWAARRLGVSHLADHLLDDPDPGVRAELARPAPPERRR